MALTIPAGFTREQLIACAERELALRKRVYPRWVEAKRMTASKALDETLAMQAVVEVLRQLPVPAPPQGALFDGGRKP